MTTGSFHGERKIDQYIASHIFYPTVRSVETLNLLVRLAMLLRCEEAEVTARTLKNIGR